MIRNHSLENLSDLEHLKKQNQSHQGFTSNKLARHFLAACVIMIELMLLPTSLESASAQVSRCDRNRMCLFEDRNFNGSYFKFQVGGPNFFYLSRDFNDLTSSYFNNTSYTWCLWDATNYQGILLAQIPPGAYSSYVGARNNDRASSLRKAYVYSNGLTVCQTP